MKAREDRHPASPVAFAGSGELPLALPRGAASGRPAAAALGRLSVPRPVVRALTRPVTARLALGTIVLGTLAVVLFAASGPSVLSPRSAASFPGWESGPLNGLIGRPVTDPLALAAGMSAVALVMLAAWVILINATRVLSLRLIASAVVLLHAIVLLSPPLPLTDVFNYIGYARLGGLHGVNPYVHGIGVEAHDPVFTFTTWHHLKSPYGPLFTALSYGLAGMSLAAAYWTVKATVIAAALAFVAVVYRCARLLGRDGRFALIFVAANPVFLLYELGGFHNDAFMLLPAMGAIALLLARRDRSAGAVLMLAVAVKFTAILLLPFLLLAARPNVRRGRLLTGAGLAAVPLVAMSIAVFGLHFPNLTQQSTLLTDFSIPNAVGWLIGLQGGSPILLRVASIALVAGIALLLRRRGPWLEGAGWATLGLIASLAWLVPWYLVWLLPLAALGRDVRLRRATVALTIYLVLAFMPVAGILLHRLHIRPMSGPPGQASRALQTHLGG